MAPMVSIHVSDISLGSALRTLLRPVPPGSVRGLRRSDVGAAAPLRSSSLPSQSIRRVGFIGFWDDEASLDAFADDHPLAERLRGGWHARLEPLRAFGTWPGLPEDLARSRHTDYRGPAVVLTLGRLRLSQARRFLRTSARAEVAAVAAPGVVWATALARPPFVATCSVWESTDALAEYAYGESDRSHADAISADADRPFHHQSAFVRFRPSRVEGSLSGANPFPSGVVATP